MLLSCPISTFFTLVLLIHQHTPPAFLLLMLNFVCAVFVYSSRSIRVFPISSAQDLADSRLFSTLPRPISSAVFCYLFVPPAFMSSSGNHTQVLYPHYSLSLFCATLLLLLPDDVSHKIHAWIFLFLTSHSFSLSLSLFHCTCSLL